MSYAGAPPPYSSKFTPRGAPTGSSHRPTPVHTEPIQQDVKNSQLHQNQQVEQNQQPQQNHQLQQNQPVLAPDDPLWCLQGYDIVYIVDDSSSMSWEESRSGIVPWPHARNALVTFASMCSAWDLDGQDVYFLNDERPVLHASPQAIEQAFNLRTPRGGTNMGRKLYQVASAYFALYQPGVTKPVNIIAITDGQFSDDVMSVLKWITDQLDRYSAMPNQFGIQFVQIGADKDAKKCLEQLDDDLGRNGMRRDIVDTVPWDPKRIDGPQFDGQYLVKVVCGAINKRLDKKSLNKLLQQIPKKKESKLRRFFG